MGLAFYAGAGVFVAAALLLSALVLIQKGGGSGWLFGAPGRGSLVTPRGAGTGLFWVTAVAFGLFLGMAIVLNRMTG